MFKTGLYVPGSRNSTLTMSASIIFASNSKPPSSRGPLGSLGSKEDALPWLALDMSIANAGVGSATSHKSTTCSEAQPLLTNAGSLWGCLRTNLTHPPTHPDPPAPYPPMGGGGGCSYNRLVTQQPCVFAQTDLATGHYAIFEQRYSKIGSYTSGKSLQWQTSTALVQSPVPTCRKFLPLFTTRTGEFCHFLTPFSIMIAYPSTHPPRRYTPPPPLGVVGTLGQIAQNQNNPPTHRAQTPPEPRG